jgi:flavin reductase (DIM6/NTAB) family NADH-FMN oxidoreductase RutF
MAPPSMLVCVNRSASAYPLLQSIDRYCINILAASQDDPLATFADPARRSDRFVGDHWQRRHGTLYLTGSPASIFCKKETVIDFGTHSIMIGRVFDVALEENGCPALWHDGAMIPLDQSKLAQS